MRDDEQYRVVPAPKIQRQAPYSIAAPRTPQGALYQNNDSNSVFLGNLPNSTTEEELREQFAYFGTILSCNIISKPLTSK
jgi:RNA recognition motif-containing protein